VHLTFLLFRAMNIAGWLTCVSRWAETHAGLGAWLGAIGSVIAIFAAWWLAHHEYRRGRRAEADRRKEQVRLFAQVVDDYREMISAYVADLEASGIYALDRSRIDLNDPRAHAMRDLAHIPIHLWPSAEAYLAFKQYFSATNDFNAAIDLSGELQSDYVSKALGRQRDGYSTLISELNRFSAAYRA